MSWRRLIFWQFILLLSLYGLGMLFVRLHMTQMAYQFDEKKDYERSLMEEQMRLRLDLNRSLSPVQLKDLDFVEPEPEQVVMIP